MALPGGRQRSLLALLLLAAGVPLSRDRLRELLIAVDNFEHLMVAAVPWIHYGLALAAYVGGELEQACEHAASADAAQATGDAHSIASAAATRLLVQSARDGAIPQPALSEVLELTRRTRVRTLAAVALWFVARYDAAVAPETAARWLAHAERILADLDVQLWPESTLRDETLAILGIEDLALALDRTPPLEHAAALAQAAAWLAERNPNERASRAWVHDRPP